MVHYRFATEEQIELANGARKICEDLLRPQLEELEKADGGRGRYPMDVHQALADAGYYGMNIPEEYGGLGLDIVTRAVIAEEIATVDSGFAFAFTNAGNYFNTIMETGISEDEKQRWAMRILSGEAIGAFALTEADAGSDAAAMRTSAVWDASTQEWVINGVKCFCSNGPIANFFFIAAWTDRSQRASKGVTVFLVEKERGIQVGKKENKMGLKTSETSEIILEDVRVPADHVVGEVGSGFTKALAMINEEGRVIGLAYNLGIAQACLDTATAYAKTRRQFGKRIIDQQAVGFKLVDMEARTQASRALMYEALCCRRDGKELGILPNLLKFYCSDCTMQTATDAVQILGGYGYMKDYPVEKLMRDAKIYQIFSGTNEIQHKNAARAIAGRDPLMNRK